MGVERLLKALMSIEHPDEVAEILSALSSSNRVLTYHWLHEGRSPQEIADELGVTRSAIQPYLTDFKEADLVRVEGKTYRFTEKGEQISELLGQLDRMHKDLSELQEFLIKNPNIVPEEVLDEIRGERREK